MIARRRFLVLSLMVPQAGAVLMQVSKAAMKLARAARIRPNRGSTVLSLRALSRSALRSTQSRQSPYDSTTRAVHHSRKDGNFVDLSEPVKTREIA